MANTRQSLKRARRDQKRRVRNRQHLSKMKTYIRNLRKLVLEGKLEEATEYLPKVVSIIQHTASKGVIHKNEASRRVSRAYKIFNSLKARKGDSLSQN
ncbi:MAG: 30S ribosomal protein S20 [Aquificaceae bacterium]|nr:30S ribosomal protein S20 [Aquificaceae bacterium]MDW8237505.1 30S ribosomal protein S20 [Aquificaceae bacterium]